MSLLEQVTLEQFHEFVIKPMNLVFKDLLSMKWILLCMKLTLRSMISVCGFPGRHRGMTNTIYTPGVCGPALVCQPHGV